MGYFDELEEIPGQVLLEELIRRSNAIDSGRCPYCGVAVSDVKHCCKFKGRAMGEWLPIAAAALVAPGVVIEPRVVTSPRVVMSPDGITGTVLNTLLETHCPKCRTGILTCRMEGVVQCSACGYTSVDQAKP